MPRAKNVMAPGELFALGRQHEAACELGAAEIAYRRALDAAPGHPDILRALALVCHRRGRARAARRYIELSIAAAPRAETCLVLAGICRAEGDLPAAVTACERASQLAPGDPAPWMEMAGAQISAGAYGAAEAPLRRALAVQPGLLAAQANLGSVLFKLGQFEASRDAFRVALAAHPQHAFSWKNLAAAERALGDFAAARAAYETAVRIAADYAEAQRDLALLDLLEGRLGEGFARYEWRLKAPERGSVPLPSPRWDGGPLNGRTVLLHYEQGFGDTLQCLRFVPLVVARGGRVKLLVQRPIARLATCLPGVEVVTGEKPPRHDVHAHLLSLPHLLGIAASGIPVEVPYLAPPPERVAAWRALLPESAKTRVGLVWTGNAAHENDRQRSIEPALLATITDVPGCVFYSLSPASEPASGVLVAPSRLSDFAETAAAIMNLDLVISVDTAVAHLAGALGKKVWVLLPAVPDWRWGLERADSTWYPTAHLFWQKLRGDWGPVLREVAERLQVTGS
jgi:tetratricopeptide (TPR) repeat protein